MGTDRNRKPRTSFKEIKVNFLVTVTTWGFLGDTYKILKCKDPVSHTLYFKGLDERRRTVEIFYRNPVENKSSKNSFKKRKKLSRFNKLKTMSGRRKKDDVHSTDVH